MPDNSLVANRTPARITGLTAGIKYWLQNQGNEAVVVHTGNTSAPANVSDMNGRVVKRLESIDIKETSSDYIWVATIEGTSSKVTYGESP